MNSYARRLIARALPLLLLACWAFPAHASTGMTSGQVVTGTIANGTQIDTYTFPADSGNGIEASLGTDGTAGVSLNVQILNSGGTSKCNMSTSTNPAAHGP